MANILEADAAVRSTFDAVAPFYDRYTRRDDYHAWGVLLDTILRRWNAPGSMALDVASGTGKSTLALAAHGYRLTACDISSGMVQQSRDRLLEHGISPLLADMRALPFVDMSFDVVNCMDDSINYLMSRLDLQAAFASARRVLRPGGLYVFDCNTLLTYRTWYATSETLDDGDVVFGWRGRCSRRHQSGQIGEGELDISSRNVDGTWCHTVSTHRQRHFGRPSVAACLAAAGLDLVACHGLDRSGSLSEIADEKSQGKAIYVARS